MPKRYRVSWLVAGAPGIDTRLTRESSNFEVKANPQYSVTLTLEMTSSSTSAPKANKG